MFADNRPMSSGNGCGRGGRGETLRRVLEARQPGAANQAQPGEANPAQAGEANPSQQLGGQPTPVRYLQILSVMS